MRPALAASLLAALTLSAQALSAQAPDGPARPSIAHIPLAVNIGVPQGPFAENVQATAGITGGLLVRLSQAVGFRAELGVMMYGSETRRVPLGDGPLGRITVDVTTTNTIFDGGLGLQVGMPGRTVMPYVGGTIGFANFATRSSVEGTDNEDEPFASSENHSDWAFSKSALAGLYLPFGKGRGTIDLGARYTWNGEEVRYLTEGDIVDQPSGPPIINARRTRADLLTFRLGVTFGL